METILIIIAILLWFIAYFLYKSMIILMKNRNEDKRRKDFYSYQLWEKLFLISYPEYKEMSKKEREDFLLKAETERAFDMERMEKYNEEKKVLD